MPRTARPPAGQSGSRDPARGQTRTACAPRVTWLPARVHQAFDAAARRRVRRGQAALGEAREGDVFMPQRRSAGGNCRLRTSSGSRHVCGHVPGGRGGGCGVESLMNARPAAMSPGSASGPSLPSRWSAIRTACWRTSRSVAGAEGHERMCAVLARTGRRRRAVVVSGHEVTALLDVADHVTWCTSGTTYELGDPATARRHDQFTREYLGLPAPRQAPPEHRPARPRVDGMNDAGQRLVASCTPLLIGISRRALRLTRPRPPSHPQATHRGPGRSRGPSWPRCSRPRRGLHAGGDSRQRRTSTSSRWPRPEAASRCADRPAWRFASALNWYLEQVAGVNVSLPLPPDSTGDVAAGRGAGAHRHTLPHPLLLQLLHLLLFDGMVGLGAVAAHDRLDGAQRHQHPARRHPGRKRLWRLVLQDLGFSHDQIAAFLVGPAYLPWGWMGNIDGLGGPLPDSWIDSHTRLERQVLERERALGMTRPSRVSPGTCRPPSRRYFPGRGSIRPATGRRASAAPGSSIRSIRCFSASVRTSSSGRPSCSAPTTCTRPIPSTRSTRRRTIPPSSRAWGTPSTPPCSRRTPARCGCLQGWFLYYQASFWREPQARALLGAVPDDRMVVLDLWGGPPPGVAAAPGVLRQAVGLERAVQLCGKTA